MMVYSLINLFILLYTYIYGWLLGSGSVILNYDPDPFPDPFDPYYFFKIQ
jgi:hypothetical protein